jgi:hypothetical protein
MPGGLHAADHRGDMPLAPSIELANLLASLKAIVADHHHAVGHVELMRMASSIAVDLTPVPYFETIERVPEADVDVVVSVHFLDLSLGREAFLQDME